MTTVSCQSIYHTISFSDRIAGDSREGVAQDSLCVNDSISPLQNFSAFPIPSQSQGIDSSLNSFEPIPIPSAGQGIE